MNQSSLKNKKVIIIGVIVIFLIVFLFAFLFKRSSTKAIPSQTTNTTAHAFPTIAVNNPFSGGSRYQGPSYSVAYPQGSQNQVDNFTGGSTFITEPPNYPNQPVLDIEAYNSTQNLKLKEYLYIATGAKQSTLTVNGLSLPELSNTYNMRTINSKPIHTPTQLRLAYLVKPNALYVFRMYYSSSVPVQADEDLFTQFIASFFLN